MEEGDMDLISANGDMDMRYLELQIAAAEDMVSTDMGGGITGTSAIRSDTRAKHLKAFLSPDNIVASPLPSGTGENGAGGHGSGGDGGGKKKPGDSALPSIVVDPEAYQNRYQPVQLFARDKGLDYINPTDYEKQLDEFVKIKWEPRIERLKDLHKTFEMDRRPVLWVRDELLRRKQQYDSSILPRIKPKRKTHKKNKTSVPSFTKELHRVIDNLANLTYAGLVRPELRGFRKKIIKEMTDPNINSGQLKKVIVDRVNVFLGLYRYIVESKLETYRSRSFTAESFAQMAGDGDVYNTFYEKDGRLKKVADFGSGCGETMFQIADGIKRRVTVKLEDEIEGYKDEIRPMIMKAVYEEWEANPSRYPGDKNLAWKMMDEETQARIKQRVEVERTKDDTLRDLPGLLKSNFMLLEQAEAFVERAKMKNLCGIKADISAEWKEFSQQTGIRPGQLHIALTSMTFDRAKSKKNLVNNMATALAPEGIAVFAMNPDYTTENDGVTGDNDEKPINYGTTDDWDLNSKNEVEYLSKLYPLLLESGLIPIRLGRHKCKVISADSINEKDKKYAPQDYDMIVLVCRKPHGSGNIAIKRSTRRSILERPDPEPMPEPVHSNNPPQESIPQPSSLAPSVFPSESDLSQRKLEQPAESPHEPDSGQDLEPHSKSSLHSINPPPLLPPREE